VAAISKRLRYEVLRRDGYACYYCGAKAPEVKLEVDAVVPEALGGSHKDPANLVAACEDCNSGKSSSSPDAPLVAAVADDAAKWAEAKAAAAGQLQEHVAEREAAYTKFDKAWSGWTYGAQKLPVPRPDDWRNSVDAFLDTGLPLDVLLWCVKRAMGSRATPDGTFRYMCGIAWRRIAELREQAGGIANGHAAASSAAIKRAHEQGRLSLARELLGQMPDEDRVHFMDHADASEYLSEDDEPQTETDLACDAISSALNSFLCDLDYLCRRTEETLRGLPDGVGDRSLAGPKDGLLKYCSPLGRRSLFLGDALAKANDYLHLSAARMLMDMLPAQERAEWLKYARALCHEVKGLDDDQWLVRAANCARVINSDRYYPEMCEAPGELIRFCAARGDYQVRLAEAECCGPGGPEEHEGHRFCARHTEQLVDGTFIGSTGRSFTAADYSAVDDSDLVPF
jgi:hypothetical protein